eukprot:6560335-Prymnesium_polylepis.1
MHGSDGLSLSIGLRQRNLSSLSMYGTRYYLVSDTRQLVRRHASCRLPPTSSDTTHHNQLLGGLSIASCMDHESLSQSPQCTAQFTFGPRTRIWHMHGAVS